MSNRARTAVSQQIAVRMPLADLARLDRQRGSATRAEVVRDAVLAWLDVPRAACQEPLQVPDTAGAAPRVACGPADRP